MHCLLCIHWWYIILLLADQHMELETLLCVALVLVSDFVFMLLLVRSVHCSYYKSCACFVTGM